MDEVEARLRERGHCPKGDPACQYEAGERCPQCGPVPRRGVRPWPTDAERLKRQARLDAEMERNRAQLRADERQVHYVAVGLLVSAGLLGAAGWWLLS